MAPINLPINGAPVILKNGDEAFSKQIIRGYMALMIRNTSPSTATWSWTAGGDHDEADIVGRTVVPLPILRDWRGNNLTVKNKSDQDDAELEVSLFSPATPQKPLRVNQPVELDQLQSCGGPTRASLMQLRFDAKGNQNRTFTVFAKSTDKPLVYALNVPSGSEVPAGYTDVSSDQTYRTKSKNWNGANLFVVNSSSTGGKTEVTLKDA